MVYTMNIPWICRCQHCQAYYNVYTMYIPCIYMVYTMNIPWICRCQAYYTDYTIYMQVIYMVYTMNIPWICRSQAYPLDIPSLVQMGLFLIFFYNDMPRICQVHFMNVLAISQAYHYKKGTEQPHLY